MRAPDRVPFSPTATFVARSAFRFNGVAFYPGDAFPGNRFDEPVPERRIRSMWDSRMIEVDTESSRRFIPSRGAVGSEPAATARGKTATAQAPDGAPVDEGEWVAKSKGFGKFSVVHSVTGAVKCEGLSKAEAAAMAAELNSETRRGAGGPALVGASSAAPSEAGPVAP